jgi:nitrogen fixation/metabolism regulation signal transduction histidine kinase
LIRVLLIVILSACLGWLITSGKSLRISLICFMVTGILIANLIAFLNTTNKKIRYFFDSVKNDDTNLTFPVDDKNKTVREIYRSMNRVNQQIQQLKIANRNQEQYFRILIEHLAIGIVTYNNKGFILHSNTSARRLLTSDVLTHIKQIERTDQRLYQTIKGIKPFERRLVPISTERGEIQLSLRPLPSGQTTTSW